MKDDGKLSRKPESESYVCDKNVLFLVQRSSVISFPQVNVSETFEISVAEMSYHYQQLDFAETAKLPGLFKHSQSR